MATTNDILIPSLTFEEILSDGSTLTNPAADHRRLFLGEDGLLHLRDSAGTITTPGGASVATDAIWDAAGDLAVGSGADTAARLAIGATNGMALQRVAGAVAWALPSGYEFNYVEKTSDTSVTATSEATADTVVTAGSVAYDGSTIIVIEFYAPYWYPNQSVAGQIRLYLYDDTGGGAASIGRLAVSAQETTAANDFKPVLVRKRLTPSAATHTYSIRSSVSTGTGHVTGGAGGLAADMPAYIRQIKA